MTGSIRNFEKLNFTPKSSVFCFSQGQTSEYDRLAHTPRTRDRCPHRVLSSASESQKTECYSRYSASRHLQKFAADLSLSTPQNSQPCKIFTLSLNSNQNLHTPAPLNSCFPSQSFKISFVLFNQEIVMQHFDLYNKYSILITIFALLKLLFRESKFHTDPRSSPLFPLKTQDPFEPPAHLALFALEVLHPEVLDTANCLNSSSSSSELITISSQAFSCS